MGKLFCAHGAFEVAGKPLPGALQGQGSAEYLVLLAVVLIIALVSVALLGFFPGMAGDAQEMQSRIYWQSASPIAITEWSAKFVNDSNLLYTQFYMRARNTGSYPIRLSRILANGRNSATYCNGAWNCNDGNYTSIYLSPGEEITFGHPTYFSQESPTPGWNSGQRRFFVLDFQMPGAISGNCSRTTPFGTAVINGFGFEYIQYIEGQPITKREVGAKPIVIRCSNNYN